ncbi:hypothetical protein VB796_18455 [Arcicella sp. LKC2W]|uniref:hypothetical protein n=1 Tax=Arcicella sp. LKC2W TaxID=2984198 RepID=UPI002B21CC43|nr:hypothetical protein [Arcicella sp. LKC2W]MEA5461050.1 hypothetical protein [Arcicella sp. LKC2W]
MKDIYLLEQIVGFHNKDDNAFRSAAKKFKDNNYSQVLKTALKKYDDVSIAKSHVDLSFNLFFVAITQFKFPKADYTTSLNILVSLPYYQNKLATELLYYLNQGASDYISTEKELKSSILHFFKPFAEKLFVKVLESEQSKNLKESAIALDWIYKSAFEIYMHLTLGKNSRMTMVRFHQIVEESFYLFVLRYSMNISLKNKVESKVNELFNTTVGLMRPYKELQNETNAIQNLSVERFFDKINDPNFILKTTIFNYLKSFFNNINREFSKGLTHEQKLAKKTKKRQFMYANLPFEREEAFEFIKEGVDAIKYLKNGYAAQLLVSGRNMNFVLILKEALGLQELSSDDFEKSLLEHYGSKESINVQRNDCKIELIKWMKNQVTDRNTNWYGQRGEQIISFLANNKPV